MAAYGTSPTFRRSAHQLCDNHYGHYRQRSNEVPLLIDFLSVAVQAEAQHPVEALTMHLSDANERILGELGKTWDSSVERVLANQVSSRDRTKLKAGAIGRYDPFLDIVPFSMEDAVVFWRLCLDGQDIENLDVEAAQENVRPRTLDLATVRAEKYRRAGRKLEYEGRLEYLDGKKSPEYLFSNLIPAELALSEFYRCALDEGRAALEQFRKGFRFVYPLQRVTDVVHSGFYEDIEARKEVGLSRGVILLAAQAGWIASESLLVEDWPFQKNTPADESPESGYLRHSDFHQGMLKTLRQLRDDIDEAVRDDVSASTPFSLRIM